ncbi:MAG: glycosyltransferase family 61 protein [Halomonas sp.]|nr:glycosyltransferase 61 family protein [Halomonas sp.]MDN6336760.1 glycosyltransferase family 61 protein [Halomonas sp.]
MNTLHISSHANKEAELNTDSLFYQEIDKPWADKAELSCSGPGAPVYYTALGRTAHINAWPKRLLIAQQLLLTGPRFTMYSLPEKQYILGSSVNWHVPMLESDLSDPAISHAKVSELCYLERGIVLTAPGFRVYGHWLLDFLPRLVLAKKYLDRFEEKVPIITRKIPPWAWPFIDALSLRDAISEYDKHRGIVLGEAVVPLAPKEGEVYSESALFEAFSQLKQYLFSQSATKYTRMMERYGANCFDKVLIVRSKPPYASNQRELGEKLEKRGFIPIDPQEYSLAEQARIFSKASIIAGEDGSALHNIAFCQPGTQVMMWGRSDRINLRHLSVARAAGVEFSVLPGSGSIGNYRVDVEALVRHF